MNWANKFNTFCFLDNHQYKSKLNSFECILAAGVVDSVRTDAGNALEQLQEFIGRIGASGQRKWLFGHLGYDLKIELEDVVSSHPDFIGFPDLFLFQPQVLICLDKKAMAIECMGIDEEEVFNEVLTTEYASHPTPGPIHIQARIQKEQYISTVQKLRQHILRGDSYEINFCQEFFSENITIDPLRIYKKLSDISPNPFSAFYKLYDKYLLCASPERFLKRQGDKIVSQPIKGTSSRAADEFADHNQKRQLQQSSKERSENVMVVDLVRNDLSKICVEGSVQVDELFGIYSFPQVHQMISTITGELKPNMSFAEIIKATFPMGSMTGAPKKRVLELIEQYEKTKRGIFSGAIGYIAPDGDFDFNVVIRSLMFNSSSHYLSFQTGSGITFYSNAEKEWEECLLKAEAIREVLQSGT